MYEAGRKALARRIDRISDLGPIACFVLAAVGSLASLYSFGSRPVDKVSLAIPFLFLAVAGFATLMAMVFDSEIKTWLSNRLGSHERLWRIGVLRSGGVARLPAVLLASGDLRARSSVASLAAESSLTDEDFDVCRVLITDGYRGSLGELFAIARGLR